MSVSGQRVVQWLEQFAPKSLAVEGDKIGLQLGTLNKQVKKVLVTLDITEAVVQEAIEEQVDLIIAHHALIFRPLAHVRTDLPAGRIIASLLQHDIAVYVAHTNLDIASGGLNDWLAERLGLTETEILSVTYTEPLKKLVTFVPLDSERKVREALGAAGAGWIGNYSHCTFRQEGIGTFLPLEGTDPYIGKQGTLEEVQEVKIETIYPEKIERKLIQALFKAHPYEEVAYDLYPLANQGESFGLGRIGRLKEQISLKALAEQVKQAFDVPYCRVVGDLNQMVEKVAILGGDGNKYMQAALHQGADVFITGDIYYHTAHDALLQGLNMIDPGHNIEKVMIVELQQLLQQMALENKVELEVLASKINTEPFSFI